MTTKQPIRFYSSLAEQNRNKPFGDIGVFMPIMPSSYVLPFQIIRNTSILPIATLELINSDTGTIYNILNNIATDDFKIYHLAQYDVITFFGQEAHTATIPDGIYYIHIGDLNNTWYSDDIHILSFPVDLSSGCALTKIEYWDTCDIDNIFYRTIEQGDKQYKNIIYLDVATNKPTYEFSEEGKKDGLGEFTASILKSSKKYNLEGIFSEYFVDALMLIPLHNRRTSVINVYDKFGLLGTMNAVDIPNPKWSGDTGTWGTLNITFSIETIIVTGCCGSDNEVSAECLPGLARFIATIDEGSDDYNNFQYTDAKDNSTKIDLANEDHILINLTVGDWELKQYDVLSSSYINIPFYTPLNGAAQGDNNELEGNNLNAIKYYFKSSTAAWIRKPTIVTLTDLGGGNFKVQGLAYREGLVRVINVGAFGQVEVAHNTGAEYVDNGITFTQEPGATGVYISCSGQICTLGDSLTEPFVGVPQTEGVGIDIVGTDSVN